MSTVIKVENLSKQYRLGTIGTGTLSHDLNRWWHKVRGKEDPYLKVGQVNDRTQKSGTGDYVWALKDVNFEVKQGEVLGVIGKNGAGKSTLLKILSRTTLPTTGSVKIKGRIASLLEVGTGFHPELTGRENIFLNGAILGMRKAETQSKFDEIVDFAGVDKYVDTPVKRYSSGMYVRLAFAVAAHLDPEILVVDEVLAVGDIEFQNRALGKMRDVSNEEGRTVLFVSHNLQAVKAMCSKVVVMDKGQITFDGSAETGLSYYLNSGETSEIQISNIIKDDSFELIAISVFQEGAQGFNFFNSKEIKITFEFVVKKRIVGLRVGFDLIEGSSDLVLFRAFHDDHQIEAESIIPGKYEIIMTIRPELLKQGVHFISPAIGIHNVRWLIFDSIRMKMNINNNANINSIYADDRPGVILPVVNSYLKNTNE